MTDEELMVLEKTKDPHSIYWIPIQWSYSLIYEARLYGKIASDILLERITVVRLFDHISLKKLMKIPNKKNLPKIFQIIKILTKFYKNNFTDGCLIFLEEEEGLTVLLESKNSF